MPSKTKLDYGKWLVDNKETADPDKYSSVLSAYELMGGGGEVTADDISKPSNIPAFNTARKSGFVKGYLDQAAGIAQIADKLKSGDTRKLELVTAGITGDPKALNIKDLNIDDAIKKEEVEYQIARKESGDTGIDWARMAGNVLNPVSIGAMASLPASAATLPAKLAASSGTGAVSLGTMPVTEGDFAKSKATQVAVGAAFGPVVTAAMVPIRGAFDLAKYLYSLLI